MGERATSKASQKVPVRSWVREARRHAGLTQEQLAERARISRRAVQFIEYGTYTPAVGVALRLAQALETQVDALFSLVEPDNAPAGPATVADATAVDKPAVQHADCDPATDHQRDVNLVDGQPTDENGLLACNHCLLPIFYCTKTGDYHHVDPDAPGCFLIPN